jgi:cytosine/adenosine deaminase-related metal-dependent hydrolase
MDLLIEGGTLVPCTPGDAPYPGDVLVEGGTLRALGAGARRERRGPVRVLDARGCAVLPGFVHAHVHLCQTLFRGMADDLPLLPWLRTRIWPLEAAHDPASLRASADLSLVELLKGGTTTVLDMGTVHHHDAVFEALRDSGLRAFSGKAMMDVGEGVPAGLRERRRASLVASDTLRTRWDGAEGGRLRYAFAPRFILSCSPGLLRDTAAMARATGCLLHTHAAEHPGERAAVRKLLGKDDVDALAEHGLQGPDTILAHGVQLTLAQARRLGRTGTRVVHCPSANLKLGSGVAQVRALRRSGVVVGLGSDGAACNNNLDLFVELRHAALLAKGLGDPEALPAREALQLATRDGSRLLGIDHLVGTLEVGKRADLVVVDLTGAHVEPWGGPEERVVYAAQARDVRHVVVDGRVLVQGGALTTLDEARVVARAREEAVKVQARAGLRG